MANNTPLSGYEPNIPDDFHYSETTEIFLQEQSSDTMPSYLHDAEISDDTIGRALSSVEESYPTPHIHEQMTTSNYGYDTAYNFTHNNIMLEPNAMNNIDTVAHMNVHNTQY